MEFFCKRRGSISIFLSIILLPCLVFTGIMVDMANLHLSKAVVESAGDLATNAALANYDTILEEVYGLFAMSQAADNPEEALKTNLNRYFDDSLMANGLLSKDEAVEVRSQLLGELEAQLFKKNSMETSPNFLKIKSVNFNAAYVENSSLANPDVLRNQIVEFMKYRGPAQVGLSMLDSLAAFKKMDKQSKVADKKMEVTKEISELSKSCKKFYDAIVEYDEKMAVYEEKEKAYLDANVETLLKSIHEDVTTYLLFEVPGIDKIIYLSENVEDNETKYDATISSAESASDSLDEILNNPTDKPDHPTKELEDGKIRASKVQSSLNNKNMFEVREAYLSYINHIYPDYVVPLLEIRQGIESKIDDLEEDEDEDEDNSDEIDDFQDLIDDRIDPAIKDVYDHVSKYLQQSQSDYNQKIANARKNISDKAKVISTVMQEVIKAAEGVGSSSFRWFNGMETSGETAFRLGEDVKNKLKNVVVKNNEFGEKIGEYAENDEFAASMRSEQEKIKDQFTENDVDEILGQLEASERYFNNMESPMGVFQSLKTYNFYGRSVLRENPFKDAATRAADRLENDIIKLVKDNAGYSDEVEQYLENNASMAQDFLDNKFNAHILLPIDSVIGNPTSVYYGKQVSRANYQVKDGVINVPKFYAYLAMTYGIKEDSNAEKLVKDTMKDNNEKSRDQAIGKEDTVAYNKAIFDDVPSEMKDSSGKLGDFNEMKGDSDTEGMDQFSTMQGNSNSILKVLANTLENVRDNVLITTYVMENFSSFANTMPKNEAKKNDMTMTHFPIDKKNNSAYGCEVEYIIYGSKGKEASGFLFWKSAAEGPERNISFAKRDIFAIRLMFNSIYALTDGQVDAYTKPPAMAIQAATGGFCPYLVAQVIIKLALAVAESAIDLDMILQGEKVALIKSKDTWVCSPQGFKKFVVDKAEEMTKDVVDGVFDTFQQVVDNTTEWTKESIENAANSIEANLAQSINGKIQDAVSTLSTITTNEIEAAFLNMYTKGIPYDKSKLAADIDAKLNVYIGKQSASMQTYLNSIRPQLHTEIVDQLQGLLEEANSRLRNNELNGAVLEAETYAKLMNQIHDVQSKYIDGMLRTITTQATTMAGEIGDDISSLIASEGEKLSKDLSEQVSNRTSELLEEYFPNEKQTIGGTDKNTNKSSMVSNILQFGYDDYLNLFLFLALTNPSESNNTVLRIADVIQLNTCLGFTSGGEGKSFTANSNFKMRNAFTYVEIKTDINVIPLLLSQRLFTNDYMKPLEYFSYKYQNIEGY